MAPSSATGDNGTGIVGHVGIEQPLERLRTGGRGRPVGVALAIAAALAALIWQPWGRGYTPIVLSPTARTTAAPVAEGATPVSATRTPDPTPSPSPSLSSGAPGSAAYVSLVDNEWTVVALLAPDALVSTEEPSIQHGTGATWSPGGPLLVLQQGLNYTVRPLERLGEPGGVCHALGVPRYRAAVQLPAGRVAYLGVTFPGMNPRAHVIAAVLDQAGLALSRVPSLAVLLSGMTQGRRYTVPSAGSGGTVLFAMAPPGILPSATYRFDIETPGIVGHRYLYACIGP
ncbi:MAG: hypothetical protein IVW53_05510 [Chloroflexi bacterium]|nr:hypothetical protein [Chloroflexota bacterium]